MKIAGIDITASRVIVALVVLVQIQGAIGRGEVPLTHMFPAGWIDGIAAWHSFLAYVGMAIIGAVAAPSALAGRSLSISAQTVAKVLIAAFVLSMFLAGGSAHAQGRQAVKQAVPALCDPLHLIPGCKADSNSSAPAAGVSKASDGSVSCSFSVFANLTPNNLQATIQTCISDANSTFEPDVEAALKSAQAYGGTGDQTGIQCLQPALAIVQAGIARPAVAAQPAVAADGPNPAIPAVAAVPAYKPGLITLFQKFREFTLAGGPTACQNWVNGTVNGAISPAAAAVVGVAAVGAGL